MLQICFQANHSQDWVFKISKIIQNFDYKYISEHVLLCTQNCHLKTNSTHCAPPHKKFHIRILIHFYINQGIAVIFQFIFLQNFSKMNKRKPTFIPDSRVCHCIQRVVKFFLFVDILKTNISLLHVLAKSVNGEN